MKNTLPISCSTSSLLYGAELVTGFRDNASAFAFFLPGFSAPPAARGGIPSPGYRRTYRKLSSTMLTKHFAPPRVIFVLPCVATMPSLMPYKV
ncbi:unnamed protein product, partial [Trichogramma brassicae]